MENQTVQLNIRVNPSLLVDLQDIAAYERVRVPELMRGWVRDRVREYLKDPRYKDWKAHTKKPQEFAEAIKRAE